MTEFDLPRMRATATAALREERWVVDELVGDDCRVLAFNRDSHRYLIVAGALALDYAHHIAMFQPAEVLALLDEFENLQKKLQQAEATLDYVTEETGFL